MTVVTEAAEPRRPKPALVKREPVHTYQLVHFIDGADARGSHELDDDEYEFLMQALKIKRAIVSATYMAPAEEEFASQFDDLMSGRDMRL